MKLIIYCILFVLLSFSSEAQTIRLPFLEGDKYSIIDENEKEVLPAEFDDVVIYEDFKVMALQKGELWGIYTMDGRKILDHVIKGKNNYGKKGPVISKAFSRTLLNYKPVDINNSLLIINDGFANVNYYINPQKVLSSYIPYATTVKSDPKQSFSKALLNNVLRVGNRDNTIMFIDSLGQEILNKPIKGGYPLTNELFSVSEGEKYALYHLNEKKTDFLFTQIDPLDILGTARGTQRVLDDKGRTQLLYWIFDKNGNVFKESIEYSSTISTHLIVQNESGFSLYDETLKETMSHEFAGASFLTLGSKSYVVTDNKFVYGLFDLNGQAILDTIYQLIRSENGYLNIQLKDTCSVLDTNFQLVLKMGGVISLKKEKNSEYFSFGKSESWYTLTGLVNSREEVIVEPEWKQISLFGCEKLVYLKSDTSWLIKSLDSDAIIIQGSTNNRVSWICDNNTITISTDSSFSKYDFEGNFKEQATFKNYQRKYNSSPSNFVVKDISGKKMLIDKDKNLVSEKSYKDIDIITNSENGESVYICQFAESTKFPNTITYNDNLKQIIPEGYSIPERWTGYIKTNIGSLLVVNNADVAKNKFNIRLGLIDFKGNWIIKPLYGTLQFVEKDLFIIVNNDKKSVLFYDHQGKLLNNKALSFVDKGNSSKFTQDRILVGTFLDESYVKKAIKIGEQNIEITEISKKMEALGKPKVLYGFLNMKAEEIIEQKYIEAKPFQFNSPKTTVALVKDGKVVSQVIDPNENVFFEGEFDELDFLGEDHFQARKEDNWAIVDTLGNVKTPYQFKTLYWSKKENYFTGKLDKEHFYITSNYKVISLGTAERADVKELDDEYIYVEKSIKIGEPYKTRLEFEILDKEGNSIVILDDAKRILNTFNTKPLPSGYIYVEFEKGVKAKIFDIKKKKYLVK